MIEDYQKPDLSSWPECPKCGSTLMVSGGVYIACVSCPFISRVEAVKESMVLKIARTRMSLKEFGERPVMLFGRGPQDKSNPEVNMAVWEKSSQITRRGVHENVFLKIAGSLRQGETMAPLVVMNYSAEDMRYATLPLWSKAHMQRAMFHASNHDVSSVIWLSKGGSRKEFSEEDCGIKEVGDSGYIMINTHFYGAPSLVSSIKFKMVNGSIKLWPRWFHDLMVDSWASQPVQWGLVPTFSSSQPRWLSVMEIKNKVNVNICVYEDLDLGPFCEMRLSDLTSPGARPNKWTIPCGTSEEGIDLGKKKMSEIRKSLLLNNVGLDIDFEKEWGIEMDTDVITMDIRSAAFWRNHASNR